MNDIDEALVIILAATDAIFVPQRDWDVGRGGNTFLARKQFAEGGVQWVGGDTSGAAGQRQNRLLGRLQEARLVRVTRGGKGRAALAKLTEEGEVRARRLCALPDLAAGWSTLAEVARLTRRSGRPRYMTDAWIAEPLLAGLRTWKHKKGQKALRIELLIQEEMALPSLVRGWVESNSTLRRQVFYKVSCAGFEALATHASPAAPAEEPEGGRDEEARTLYYRRVREGIANLGISTPEGKREIGAIPLPCAIQGVLADE